MPARRGGEVDEPLLRRRSCCVPAASRAECQQSPWLIAGTRWTVAPFRHVLARQMASAFRHVAGVRARIIARARQHRTPSTCGRDERARGRRAGRCAGTRPCGAGSAASAERRRRGRGTRRGRWAGRTLRPPRPQPRATRARAGGPPAASKASARCGSVARRAGARGGGTRRPREEAKLDDRSARRPRAVDRPAKFDRLRGRRLRAGGVRRRVARPGGAVGVARGDGRVLWLGGAHDRERERPRARARPPHARIFALLAGARATERFDNRWLEKG